MRHWSLLLEADDRLRRLQRAWEASGLERDLEAYHHAMVQAGRGHETVHHVVKPHVDRFSEAYRHAHRLREAGHKHWYSAWQEAGKHKRAMHDVIDKHGELVADHINRQEGESQREFQDRLVDSQRGLGTYRPSAGNVNFDNHAWSRPKDKDADPTLHQKRAQASARAWNRNIDGGAAEIGTRYSYDLPDEHGNQKRHEKGSYVFFHRADHPQ